MVSKTELLDHVWDAAEDTDPNAVEVYVGYLRRKLGRGRAARRSAASATGWLRDRVSRSRPVGRLSLRARLMLSG